MPRRKISLGILVLETHENYFVNICRIANTEETDLTIFTTDQYFEQVSGDIPGLERSSPVIKSSDESMRAYLRRVEQECAERIDVLLILPLHGHVLDFLSYVSFCPACKTILTIYNVNTWTLTNLSFTPRLYKYLTLPLRKVIFERVDAVIVEFQPIKEYLDSVAPSKLSFAFTPMLHEDSNSHQVEERRNFTISGHITASRRDYGLVFDALEQVPRGRQEEIEIHLLGQPQGNSGDRILARCNRLQSKGFNIGYHEQWIPVSEFDNTLRRSHAVICPLYETRTTTGAEEIYGISKGSGCIGDGIRFGLPIVLPATYEVPAEIQPAVHQYEEPAELCEIMLTLAGGDYERHRRRAVETAKQFTLEEQQKRFQAILSDLVEG